MLSNSIDANMIRRVREWAHTQPTVEVPRTQDTTHSFEKTHPHWLGEWQGEGVVS